MAQLDASSDWRPGGRGFNPRWGRQHFFVEIDHETFSTVILSLPLNQEGQLSVSGERMCTILVNCLEDEACPVNVWLGKLTALDMTPMGWLGRKTSTQTNRGIFKSKSHSLAYPKVKFDCFSIYESGSLFCLKWVTVKHFNLAAANFGVVVVFFFFFFFL